MGREEAKVEKGRKEWGICVINDALGCAGPLNSADAMRFGGEMSRSSGILQIGNLPHPRRSSDGAWLLMNFFRDSINPCYIAI